MELPRQTELDATNRRYPILNMATLVISARHRLNLSDWKISIRFRMEKWCPDRDLNPGHRLERPRCWAGLHYRGIGASDSDMLLLRLRSSPCSSIHLAEAARGFTIEVFRRVRSSNFLGAERMAFAALPSFLSAIVSVKDRKRNARRSSWHGTPDSVLFRDTSVGTIRTP